MNRLLCSLAITVGLTGTLIAQERPQSVTPADLNKIGDAISDAEAQEEAIRALSARIDRHLAAQWAEAGVRPAEPISDAEFLRRISLDIIGRIPRVSEIREFLADPDPDKRAKWVNRLLESPAYAAHFSIRTRDEWLPGATDDQQKRFQAIQVETWLQQHFQENTPYDQVVRELLLTPINAPGQQQPPFNVRQTQALNFFQINENKPELVAATASRLFLGVKLECAQCHDHPFAPYTKEQFWEFAAFFTDVEPGLPRPREGRQEDFESLRTIRIPNTDRTATARFLDGSDPDWQPNQLPREALVEWLTSRENPYFARNAVNRLWAGFFGVGIIDPVDEPGLDNPPSHPELLNDLADAFALSNYDPKFLIRAITRTQAYQLSSRTTEPSQDDPRLFAKMSIKGLTPDQLFNSLAAATGFRENANNRRGFQAFQIGTPRGDFLDRFANTQRATETQTSILQALMLMNGDFVDAQTNLESSNTLTAIAEMPFAETPDRIEALFLAALGRQPHPEELADFTAYVESGGPAGDPKQALGDVFWALLNSSEFMFNH